MPAPPFRDPPGSFRVPPDAHQGPARHLPGSSLVIHGAPPSTFRDLSGAPSGTAGGASRPGVRRTGTWRPTCRLRVSGAGCPGRASTSGPGVLTSVSGVAHRCPAVVLPSGARVRCSRPGRCPGAGLPLGLRGSGPSALARSCLAFRSSFRRGRFLVPAAGAAGPEPARADARACWACAGRVRPRAQPAPGPARVVLGVVLGCCSGPARIRAARRPSPGRRARCSRRVPVQVPAHVLAGHLGPVRAGSGSSLPGIVEGL